MRIDIEQLKTDAAYWDSVAPEGATHFGRGNFWYKVVKQAEVYWWKGGNGWGSWDKCEYAASSIASDKKFIKRPTSTEIPVDQPKKQLTQAVFDGLPAEYRWAVVDANGECWGFTGRPVVFNDGFYLDDDGSCLDDGAYDALFGLGYDTTNWQNSLIERQDVPTAADIDWIDGAAYWCNPFPPMQPSGFFINADFTQVHDGVSWVQALPPVNDLRDGTHSKHVVKRPESVTDIARSLEAARIEEHEFKAKPCPHGCVAATIEQVTMPYPDDDARHFETSDVPETKKYPYYFKDVSNVAQIDVYSVLRLFEVTDPCLQHIVKKALCAGKRGAKDFAKDVQEIADTADRLIELEQGK